MPRQSPDSRSIRLQKASSEVQNLLPGTPLNDALRQRPPPTNYAEPGYQRLPTARLPPGQRPLIRKIAPPLISEAGTRGSGISRGGSSLGNGRGGLSDRGGGRGKGTKRKSTIGGGFQSGEDGFTEFTAEEEAYFKEKARRDAPTPVAYHPGMTAEDLTKLGPAIFLGQWGMSEIVEEKLAKLAPAGQWDQGTRPTELTKDMLSGEFVRFKNDEELKKILTLAESEAKRYAERRSEEKGEVVESEPVEFETLDEDTKARLCTKWFKGEYALQSPSPEVAVLQHLRVATGVNASYLPKDQDSIAEKVRGLLPTQTSSSAPRLAAR